MANKPTPVILAQAAVDAVAKYGSKRKAAIALKIPEPTLYNRYRAAETYGLTPGTAPTIKGNPLDDHTLLKEQLRKVEAQLATANRETLSDEFVKREIIKLAEQKPDVPTWLVRKPKAGKNIGVPTLFASDWHWGEVVDPKQIGGVNAFDMGIAQERARAMVEVTIDIVRNHLKIETPGIVFALGGDMVSGDIHEELMATNQTEMMPTIIDLYGVLIWCIRKLADEFGNVFVPCVSGNHGRNTHKIRAKGRNYTNFDWLLYQFLAKAFEGDKRVCFQIPDGPDALYAVYGHKYLLTHGDQFRGGDGMIGALGPIIRGDHKKRSRNAQIDAEYDTLLLGHWHQLIQLQRLIVNGSLKGYDEYANSNNFGFEPPRQALWITNPVHGITFSAPVNVDRSKLTHTTGEWVAWK